MCRWGEGVHVVVRGIVVLEGGCPSGSCLGGSCVGGVSV